MCGICGLIKYGETGFSVDEALIKSMSDCLLHRGPDDEGTYFDFTDRIKVALAMRRLSIIDLPRGKQPIKSEDGSVIVILNGEIYNYNDLRKELEKKGHKLSTESDTETLVHLYEEYGVGLLSRIRGMFAFAIYDKKNNKVFIARDRVGKKPLYYTFRDGYFAFASEMKSLLKIPGIKKEIRSDSIDEYLTYGYISSPRSIFKNIFKLPPASYLVFDGKKTRLEKYWELDFRKKINISFEEAKSKLYEELKEAVRLRLYSDVPLGAFLSGGIDSSVIVSLMSELSSSPVKTFSIGFEEQDFSELKYAKQVAEKFGTEHHEIIVRPNAIEDLPKLVYYYGEPFSDSSALPSYYVSREARKNVKVVLNGDGGDESFAGYLRYKANVVSARIAPLAKLMGLNQLVKILPKSAKPGSCFRQLQRFMQALGEDRAGRNLLWHIIFTNEEKDLIYSPEMKKQTGEDKYKIMLEHFFNAKADNDLEKFLYSDIVQYLPEDLLVKMDIASMMNSLEARSPFLDHKLLEFVASLPTGFKFRYLSSKYILKETFKKNLPGEVLKRKKMGFGIPIGYWFQGKLRGYVREILLDKRSTDRGYFRKEEIEKLIEEHISGKSANEYRLWNLLFLELWHREYID